MGEAAYGGESVGKKIARMDFWRRAQLWHGSDFSKLRHLVLASREGGDVSILLALGVPPENVLAVDLDHEALDVCKSRFPRVTAIHGDVGDVLRDHSCLGTVFLDFCGWATDEQVATVARACSAVRERGVVGHGYMRGREQGEHRATIQRERFASKARAAGMARAYRISAELCEGSDGRHGWILGRLIEQTRPLRLAPLLLWSTLYHSTCSWRHGVPMTIVARGVWGLSRCGADWYLKEESKRLAKDWNDMMLRAESMAELACRGSGIDPSSANGFELLIEPSWKHMETGRALSVPSGKSFCGRDLVSLGALVAAADAAEKLAPGRAHEILNIRKQRLAAFRAHATRGSYAA